MTSAKNSGKLRKHTARKLCKPSLRALTFSVALPEPVLHYGDYAIWQREHLNSPTIRRQLDHWREVLKDAPPKLDVPTDRVLGAVPTYAGSMENFEIGHGLTEALKRFSQRHGVTLYMTLLAAYTAMLNRYTGEEDILVGGVTDLRRRPELTDTLGALVARAAQDTAAYHREYELPIPPAAVPTLQALYGGALLALLSLPPERVTRDAARGYAAAMIHGIRG